MRFRSAGFFVLLDIFTPVDKLVLVLYCHYLSRQYGLDIARIDVANVFFLW